MKFSKLFLGLIVIVGVAFLLSNKEDKESQKPYISVSSFALYDVAVNIAGDEIEVFKIISDGSDAHMFEPTPKDLATIELSKLFIYNGAGFEAWADKLSSNISSKIIDMSVNVELLESHHHCDHDEDDDEHHHGNYDPHYWQSIENMITIAGVIERELSQILPEKSEQFRANRDSYIDELRKLENEYKTALSDCKIPYLVTSHNAFGYLGDDYGFSNISVVGLSSDEQPSAKNIADIVELVRDKGIKAIYFEEFIDDGVAATIAKETGAEVDTIHPLGNITKEQSGMSYIEIMRENLSKLRYAMECN